MGPLQRNGHISLRAGSPVVSGKCSSASWQSRRKEWGEKGRQTTQCSGARKTKRFHHSKSQYPFSPTALFALQQGAYVRCDSFSVKSPFTLLRCAAMLSETHNPLVTLYPGQNATHVVSKCEQILETSLVSHLLRFP